MEIEFQRRRVWLNTTPKLLVQMPTQSVVFKEKNGTLSLVKENVQIPFLMF